MTGGVGKLDKPHWTNRPNGRIMSPADWIQHFANPYATGRGAARVTKRMENEPGDIDQSQNNKRLVETIEAHPIGSAT